MTNEEMAAFVLQYSQMDDWSGKEFSDEEKNILEKFFLAFTMKDGTFRKRAARNRLTNAKFVHPAADETIKAFEEMDIEMSKTINGVDMSVTKFAGDNNAQVADSEGNIIAYIKYATDTRYPWMIPAGDTRPRMLISTNRGPGKAGKCKGWEMLDEILKNGKTIKREKYHGDITLMDIDVMITREIVNMLPRPRPQATRQEHFNENIPNVLAMKFLRGTFHAEEGDLVYDKEATSQQATLTKGGNEIAQIRLVPGNPGRRVQVFYTSETKFNKQERGMFVNFVLKNIYKPQDNRPAELKEGVVKDFASL